jgi:AcrR family transcriptional regulator
LIHGYYPEDYSVLIFAFSQEVFLPKNESQAIDIMIKKPKQARAKQTVKLIFEATAQIILREGIEKLTTTRIAERAGVSIGTLYQYFGGREAVLLAMAVHEKDLMIGELDAFFTPLSGKGLSVMVDALVRDLMQMFYRRQAIRRTIARSVFQQQPLLNLYGVIAEMENHLASKLQSFLAEAGHDLPAVAAYVASRSLIGTLRAGMLESSAWSGTDGLRVELTRMTMGILSARSELASGERIDDAAGGDGIRGIAGKRGIGLQQGGPAAVERGRRRAEGSAQ